MTILDFKTSNEAVMEICSRVKNPVDDTLYIGVHYKDRDQGLWALMTAHQVRALYNYLDMENVPPFTAECGPTSLKAIQEPDGRTWIRVYRTDSGRSKLALLSDRETGALYEWLSSALEGKWDGWCLNGVDTV